MGWSDVCIESICPINNKSVYWTIDESVGSDPIAIYRDDWVLILALVIAFQCLQDS